MAKKLTPAIVFLLMLQASVSMAQLLQPCFPGQGGFPFCDPDKNCVRCPFGAVQGNTQLHGAPQGVFPPFCGTLSRPAWYAFVAGATSGAFLLDASNCVEGQGLQMALYDDCGAAPLNCMAGGLSINMQVSNLTIGETYFLLVDGYQGDDCAYTLQAADSALTTPPVLNSSQITLSGPATACIGETAQYCLSQPVDGASHYYWSAPQGSIINNLPVFTDIPAPAGACVTVTFSQISGQVRVTPKTSCSQGTTISKTVTVSPNKITHLGTKYVSADSLPYLWLNGHTILSVADTTYHLMAVLTSYQGCDSIVRQTIVVYQPNTAYGLVYWDVNNNGTYDSAVDKPYPFGVILESDGGPFAASGPDGKYKLGGLNDLDTVRVAPVPGLTVTPAFQPYDKNQTPWANRNFGLYPPPLNYDLDIFTTNTTAVRPGFNAIIEVICKNTGLSAANGVQIILTLPPILNYLNASATPGQINGDTLIWNVGSIAPGATVKISVTAKCDLIPIGTPFQLLAAASGMPAANDVNPANNTFSRPGTVVGSYDPNDKQVAPQYLTPNQLATGNRQVEYTIRFQNTGNYPAEFVRIIDTLGPGLDPAGFRFLASSHPCTWTLSGNGVVEFFFKDINLPDSVSNEPESHGFVTFTVRLKSSLQLGDMAENFADIYFDFNPPIRTNTAGTQIVYFLPDDPPAGNDMSARPNPASYVIHFAWLTPLREPGFLRLFTVNGVPAAEMPVAAGAPGVDLYVADQPPGVYIAVLESEGKRYVQTVVVQRAGGAVRRMGKN